MGDLCHVCKIQLRARLYQCGACFKMACGADVFERAWSFICRRCKATAESPTDPRDAHIAELGQRVRELEDALQPWRDANAQKVGHIVEIERERLTLAMALVLAVDLLAGRSDDIREARLSGSGDSVLDALMQARRIVAEADAAASEVGRG